MTEMDGMSTKQVDDIGQDLPKGKEHFSLFLAVSFTAVAIVAILYEPVAHGLRLMGF